MRFVDEDRAEKSSHFKEGRRGSKGSKGSKEKTTYKIMTQEKLCQDGITRKEGRKEERKDERAWTLNQNKTEYRDGKECIKIGEPEDTTEGERF